MYNYVVFDLDGTLLDTLSDLAAAGNHALTAMSLPVHTTETYRTMVGNGIPKLVERMLPVHNRGSCTQQLALKLFSSYYENHKRDFTSPYPGIVEMLHCLKQAGVVMAVASNKADAFTKELVAHYFPGIFQIALGLQEGAMPKPDPQFVMKIMQHIGAEKYNTLYVGDSDVDMLTAKNAGLDSCGVLWGFRTRDELLENGAKMLAEDPAELQGYVLT